MESPAYNYIEHFVEEVLSSGKISFSLQDAINRFPGQSVNSVKLALYRQVGKQKIISFYKGYYLIIPPEYKNRKILPLELFVDRFFNYLNREYYVSLLSAAVYHGSSHQQPMEAYVNINKPPMRRSNSEGLKVNYIVKSNFPNEGLIKRKTDYGYMIISGPELTAADLVMYSKRVGGINRVADVLAELADSMNVDKLKQLLSGNFPVAILQRLGYLLDFVIGRTELTDPILEIISERPHFKVRLNNESGIENAKTNSKWKMMVNHKFDLEIL
ncbi:MAG: hypothetical protein HUU54_14025 [Ignavibacteriaceae bacterium]|nr:hypothetical protein [Ignavibacteriaceae bacterium]